jgi:hypothetical protein
VNTPPAILIQRLMESRVADDETAGFLAGAFEAWLAPGADSNLARHMIGPGRSRDQLRVEMRNTWLREAARLLKTPPTASRARALLEAINAFERRKWPIWRQSSFPPAHASELEAVLFYALRTGARMPTTRQQIHEICKSDRVRI